MPIVAAVALSTNMIQSMTIDLWPTGTPDNWSRTDAEVTERDTVNGYDLVRNVSNPTLTVTAPHPEAATVLICPGGGYWVEAIEHEGTEIAKYLTDHGFNAAILKYRLPNRDQDKPLHKAPLQDAQRAIRLLRHHAEEWKLDAQRIGIMGFSAGGHLAAMASTTRQPTYTAVDGMDGQSSLPDFTVLVYPAYLNRDNGPELSTEVMIDKDTPPSFIVQTMDDRELVMSAFAYAIGSQRAGVDAELHVYARGGHGYGLRKPGPGIGDWPELLTKWLRGR